MSYTRFAVYYVPPAGDLADFGATWLGWDVIAGAPSTPFDIAGLDDVTMTPRKYGFHGTLKPPFRMADGCDLEGLKSRVTEVCTMISPATCGTLELARLGQFLALTPTGRTAELAQLAAACVTQLDSFRAPPSAAELTRRRAAGLSPQEEANLQQWGYPYVLDAFRFHLTLTGKLDAGALPAWQETVTAHLPPLPDPFVVDQIALVGERSDGRFELIQRYALAG